jgi:hypothetical protein
VGLEWSLLLGRLAEGAEWIQLAQDRDMWRYFCEYGDEPPGSSTTELISSFGGITEQGNEWKMCK